MSELARVVAHVFRLAGKERMPRNEFKQVLSFRLNWYPPQQASQLLERALAQGLLAAEGEELRPAFDPAQVDVPLHFRGTAAALTAAAPLAAAPATAASDPALVERAQALRAGARGRLRPEVALLMARRERGEDVAAEAARALQAAGVQRSQADAGRDLSS